MKEEILPHRHIKLNVSSVEDRERLVSIANALASPVRVAMLYELSTNVYTISELAKRCFVTISTALFHSKVLEDAGLIKAFQREGSKKNVLLYRELIMDLFVDFDYKPAASLSTKRTFTQSVPIGAFHSADLGSRFAFVNEFEILPATIIDDWYSLNRWDIQLLWTECGKITYQFSNAFSRVYSPDELTFSLEICSEAPTYKNDWKSDIDFIVNGVKIATYQSPGDFGGRKGKLNPSWWPDNCSQYGQLIFITIDKNAVYVNGVAQENKITLADLAIEDHDSILFTVESSKSAEYCGGFNIFGKGFGDHEQDILLSATCSERKK